MYALDSYNELSDSLKNKAILLGSFMTFLRVFFELKTGRPFTLSQPVGRESHFITIAKELKSVFRGEVNRLIINVPPGHGKSTILAYWVAWCMANYPDSNFLYISYAYELAEKHTSTIKEIMEMPLYRELFGVELRTDSKAKGKFKTTSFGTVMAFGSSGAVTGQDAGLPNLDRFSGGIIIDDAHKPDECHSDTIRQGVIDNFNETIKQRPRGPTVPIIFIGQRLHEEDLPSFLISGEDGYDWRKVILPALDVAGNALYPEAFPKDRLLIEQRVNRYTFAAQMQQNPQPAGGGIFKKDDFLVLDMEPHIISSFVTIDTAESEKKWNDATAMSFWGVYRIEFRGIDTGMYGLHWLGCREVRIEPKDLENEFFDFYTSCMRHRVKPQLACIEKASTGVTLCSTLKGIPGLRVVEIEVRGANAKNKMDRFIDCQKYVAGHHITFTKGDKHIETCLEHMRKITANNSHAHDDIADTMQIAIQYALIEESILPKKNNVEQDAMMADMISGMTTISNLRAAR